MIKKIQIRIIIIFLLLGITAIGVMGYLSCSNLQEMQSNIIENIEEYHSFLSNYQNQMKLLTFMTIGIFAFLCLLIRIFGNQQNDSTN